MRLLSATVRHYRIHRETAISFDPSRTLIGGGNETGKSTLIEAIHHALFLRSTVTGAVRDAMQSHQSSGHPEVEVRFEARGARYHLTKQFRGANGTTLLVEEGGRTLRGPEAEERLGELLGAATVGGRGAAGRLRQQWGHLWVWQGESGRDPSEHAAAQRDELLRQLQRIGGGVALQSERDGRLAARFAEERSRIFTEQGRPKRDSDLHRANDQVTSAEEAHEKASRRLEDLREAVRSFEESSAAIPGYEDSEKRLRRERKDVEERARAVEELQRTEGRQEDSLRQAAEKREALETAEEKIEETERELSKRTRRLEPKRREASELRRELEGLRQGEKRAESAYRRALEATRSARARRDLAAVWVGRFEKELRLDEIEKRAKRAQKHRTRLEGRRKELARLPEIDRETLEAMQELDRKLDRARAARDAIATEIQVIKTDSPVRLGKIRLGAGEKRTVVEPTEIRAGKALHLRIHPGGGKKLVDARHRVADLEREIQQELDERGLSSMREAAKIVTQRETLEAGVEKAESALQELGADRIPEELDGVREELEAAKAEIARRQAAVANAEAPASQKDATEWLERETDALRDAEIEEDRARMDRDDWQERRAKADKSLEGLMEKIQTDAAEETGLRAKLEVLVKTHGDEKARATTLAAAQEAEKKADSDLAATKAALAALQPELLERDRKRLERALAKNEESLREAERRRAASGALLRSDGGDDPQAALAVAAASLDLARARHAAADCKARALALLHELFQREQRELSERFSQPLAARITGFLSCLFGPEAHAVVKFEGNEFGGIELVRGRDGALRFDSLSGGAREQVAAAVRLAVAELLAADHEGCLPVVFDDAFAYSDPQRVNTLQRMLDRAAENGLQLVVLTCNPSDYAALGARQVTLAAPTTRGGGGEVARAVTDIAAPRTAAPETAAPGTAAADPTSPWTSAPEAGTSEGLPDGGGGNEVREPPEDAAAPLPSAPEPSGGDADLFLAALKSLGGRSGNRSLRRHLGWEDDRYDAVKERLVAAGRIRRGAGRGGSVLLVEQPAEVDGRERPG